MGKEIVDGQISIFDILSFEDREESHVPQIMLKEGDVVYKVLKGDVCQYTVTEEKSWIFGTDNRGYRLVDKDGIYNPKSLFWSLNSLLKGARSLYNQRLALIWQFSDHKNIITKLHLA